MPTGGDRTLDPTVYEEVGVAPIDPIEIMSTVSTGPAPPAGANFTLWRGNAFPGGLLSGEYGNKVYFGAVIEAEGSELLANGGNGINLDNLEFCLNWTGGWAPNPTLDVSFSGASYSSTRVGVNYGADAMLGGGDDTLVTAGAGTTAVDAIYYVGVGDSAIVTNPDGLSAMEAISSLDTEIRSFGPQFMTGEYKYLGEAASATVTITPEPSGLASLILAGLFGFSRLRRRFFGYTVG